MINTIYLFKLFALVRAFFYLYITVEASMLAYLYWNAYKKYKTSEVIRAVQMLLFSVGLNFFYMTIIAMISYVDATSPLYDFMIIFIPFFAMPLMFSIKNFREKSTDEVSKDGKNLIESYKLKGKKG